MGILDAALDSIGGVLADQWQDVITAGPFDEHTVVVPGIRKNSQNGRGNNRGADDIISNGSVIFVPENTAAFVFSQSGIEQVITSPGGFEYRDGEATLFDAQDRREKGIGKILVDQAAERIRFSGMSPEEKRVAFVNLREIRGLKFGTRGPLAYNDLFYGTDLEVFAYGSFSVQVSDAELFVRNFVPANVSAYSLDDPQAREQLRRVAAIKSWIDDYDAIAKEVEDLELMPEFLKEGVISEAEMDEHYARTMEHIEALELRNMLRRDEDKMGAIVDINAGAGGTEALDWASMLLRMYTRWCEAHGYKVKMLDYQAGDEVGVKSCTMEVEGDYAYGYLKSETGVHRMVRLSPFNANNKRQTTFASVFVSPAVDDSIEIVINPADIEWDTSRRPERQQGRDGRATALSRQGSRYR